MVAMTLPRFVQPKPLAGGATGFYWTVPAYWRKQGCPYTAAALGVGLSQAELDGAAATWNERFDGWRLEQVSEDPGPLPTRFGTVRWLFEEYLRSEEFRKRVKSEVARPDYRRIFNKIAGLSTERPELYPDVGTLPTKTITPRATDKLYARMCEGGKFRRGEKAVAYCKTAWGVMARLYPDAVGAANPWAGLTLERRTKKVKPAVDREMVYRFAWGSIDAGRPELAVAAVVCFEWLQRPANIVLGHLVWNDYRGPGAPSAIRIQHHKNDAEVTHPLEEVDATGAVTLFYADAEAIIARMPRRGLRMILGPDGQTYQLTRFAQLVRREADRLGLPKVFTLDACRHGGMTELEEAELTEGQGRALSAHKTGAAYRGYAKRTTKRVLAATRRRIAYRLANVG